MKKSFVKIWRLLNGYIFSLDLVPIKGVRQRFYSPINIVYYLRCSSYNIIPGEDKLYLSSCNPHIMAA
jgi:hypothetical protein